MNVVVAATDQELWQEALGGRADAFGTLFERHAKAVYNFCFRRTGSWAAAEDLTSEVFLLAWRRRRDVVFTVGGDSVLPWLYGVALNVLRNRARSQRRATAALARLGAEASEADFSDDVVGRLADERRMRDVLAVVDRLTVPEQEVLALCAWGALGYEDAALVLGIPIGTVRSRLARARAHLAELVASGGHELVEGACGC